MQAAFYSAACFYKRSEYPADSLRVRALHYCNNIDKQKDKTQKLNKKTSDRQDLSRRSFLLFNHQVGYCYAVEEVVDELIELCPHRAGTARAGILARGATALNARDGRKRALSELQNLTDSVLLRLSFEPVAAAFSVRALDEPRFRERCHNTFEIFERELFALGNLLERDKSAVLFIFGKIRHDAQGVSAAA